MTLNVTVFCFLASYGVALGLEMTRLLRRATIGRVVTLLFATAGVVAHTMYLFNRAGETNLPPLLSSTHDWMLVLAWLAVVVYLFVTAVDPELPLGAFVLPLVLALIGAAYFVSYTPNSVVAASEATNRSIRSWGMLHAGLLVFGIVGVIGGFVLSMMYLLQHRRLRKRQTLTSGLALPSLERLARLNRWSVIVSVPLLFLGMLMGVRLAFLTREGPVHTSFADPVVIVNSVVLIGMIVFLVWLVSTHRPTGKQVAWLTLFAFGFLLVTLIGLQVITGGHTVPTWHTHSSDDAPHIVRTAPEEAPSIPQLPALPRNDVAAGCLL